MKSFCTVLFLAIFFSGVHAQTTSPKIAVGAYHSLVLSEDGKVYVFGNGVNGVLGLGSNNRMDIPILMDHESIAGKTIVDVQLDYDSGLFLMSDNTLYRWGDASEYQFGSDFSSATYPVEFTHANLDTAIIIAIEKGDDYSMLLSSNGTVFVMGENFNSRLGINASTTISSPTPIDRTNLTGEKIIKMSSADSHTLLLTESNKLFAFGQNSHGEVGDSTFTSRLSAVEISNSNFDGKTIKDFVATKNMSLALTTDGAVYSWGYQGGAHGNGSFSIDITIPMKITHPSLEGKAIRSISRSKVTHSMSTILVATDGTVYATGDNVQGQLGIGDFTNRDTSFTQIPPTYFQNKTIVEAHAGNSFSLFKASDGTLFGAGKGAGTGYDGNSSIPIPVDATHLVGKSISRIASSSGEGTGVLIDTAGAGYIFTNYLSPVFIFPAVSSPVVRTTVRDINTIKDTPTLLTHSNLTGHTIIDVKAGGRNSYLLTDQGKVFSFGSGVNGTLGLGDSVDVLIPTLITHSNISGKKIVDISVGWNRGLGNASISHALLLADDGTVFSMGSNDSGQLGVGDEVNRFVPTPVTTNLSGKTIVQVIANALHSMAIASDGTVYLWGDGRNGEMGFGNTNSLNVPTLAAHVSTLGKTIVGGAIGFNGGGSALNPHFLILASDNTIYSFGENGDGGLGQGDKTNNYVPTQVEINDLFSGEKIELVQAGYQNTSLVKTNKGRIFSWGNVYTVGHDKSVFSDYLSPTLVSSDDTDGRRILTTAIGHQHGLALVDDGTVLSFGQVDRGTHSYGALGNGHSGTGEIDDYLAQKLPTAIPSFTARVAPIPATNLVLHLDAERGVTASQDSLNTWKDLSGNDHDGYENNLTRQPMVVDRAINNQRAVRFSGSNWVTLPTASSLGIQNSDYEVFIVAKSATSNMNTEFLMGGSLAHYELHVNGEVGVRFIPTASTYIDEGTAGDFTNGTAQLYNARATDTYGSISVNRANTSQSSVNARSTDAGTLYLGVRANNTLFLNGDIAEVIIYNTVLSDADRGKVERYLFRKYKIKDYSEEQAKLTGTEGWRLMASPVSDSTLSPLFRNLWTQGFTGASVSNGTSSVYTWSTANATSDNTNWTALTDIANSPGVGSGSLVYVFSDDNGPGVEGDAGFPKTMEVEGIEPSGDRSLTSLLNTNVGGYTLLGNPFKKDVDWDSFTKSNLSNSVYVYDNGTEGWKSWNGTLGSLSDGDIGAFNGFFVQTMGADPMLIVPQAAKKDSANSFLGKQLAKINPFYFSLELACDSGYTNKAWFQFSSDGEFGVDASDAFEFAPLSSHYVSLASVLNDSTTLDINSLPLIEEPIEIPLVISTTEIGSHSFSLKDITFPEDWLIELYDSETEIRSELQENYTFVIESSKAKSVVMQNLSLPQTIKSFTENRKIKASSHRFILKIRPSKAVFNEVDSNIPESVELQQNYPNPFNPSSIIQFGVPTTSNVYLEVYDLLGRKVATLINGESRTAGRYNVPFNASNLASGMYLYRLQVGSTVFTKKLTLIK